MKIKHVFILFFLSLMLFTPYFLRNDMTGADPYHYLSFVCQENYKHLDLETTPPLFKLILPMIGCSLIAIKLMLFALLCASVYFIARLGELFNKENGWIAGVFALGFSPVIFYEFVKFENDQFAYPLLFAAAFYFFKGICSKKLTSKGIETDKKKMFLNIIFSLILILIASGFWYGSIFFLIGLSLASISTIIFSIPIVFLFWQKLLAALLEGKTIIENKMFIAIPDFGFLNLAFFVFKKNKMLLPLLFFSVIGILARKFAVLAVPFLAVACLNLLDNYLLKKMIRIDLKFFFGMICVIMIVHSASTTFNFVPKQHDWMVVDSAIQFSEDYNKPLFNHWGYGYWLHWRGTDTNSFGGINPDLNLQSKKGIVLTIFDLNYPCEILLDSNRGKIYDC